MSEPRELLVRLLDYIKEQAKVIDPHGYQLSSVKTFVRRPKDLTELPGVETDVQLQGDHIWLRVARLKPEPAPAIPAAQRSYLRSGPEPEGPPPTIDQQGLSRQVNRIIATLPPDKRQDPKSRTDIEAEQLTLARAMLGEYMQVWNRWATSERPRRKTIALYGDLFALKQQLETQEAVKPQELVWGIGITRWRIKDGQSTTLFEYPLLSQALEISIDEESMAIDLRPRAVDTRIELDAFFACNVPGIVEVDKAIRDHFKRQRGTICSPFDVSSYAPVLKLIAGGLDPDGIYEETAGDVKAGVVPGETLVVTDEGVLLSRPKAVNFLFDDLKRLSERLEEGCEIPPGPLALVSPPSDASLSTEIISFRGLSSSHTSSAGNAPIEELYFPLSYNEEQVTIVQRLRRAPGVTVQGPPGTGKTHTIANIICHYLACGKRVLVTSKGDPALKELQSKIPEAVRALTVSLLTSDREGVRQFQGSIETIQQRVSQLNPEIVRKQLTQLHAAIEQAHSEIVTVDRRVNTIAEQQLSGISVDGVEMRAQQLAELVLSGEKLYGWFDDAITLAPENAPPLSPEEGANLRSARRRLAEDLIYTRFAIPSLHEIPNIDEMAELHHVLLTRNQIQSELDSGVLWPLRETSQDELSEALQVVERALRHFNDLAETGSEWALTLRVNLAKRSFTAEKQALEALFPELDKLVSARAAFLQQPVTIFEETLTSQKVAEAIHRASATGKPFGIIALGAGDTKQQVEKLRISGRKPTSLADWQHIERYLNLHQDALSFAVRWNELTEGLGVPRLRTGVTALRDVEIAGRSARLAHEMVTTHDVHLRQAVQTLFKTPPACGNNEELEELRRQLLRHSTLMELASANRKLASLSHSLMEKSGPVTQQLHTFLEADLGDDRFSRAEVIQTYSEILKELRRVTGLEEDLSLVRTSAERFKSAGAPNFATRICDVPVMQSGEDSSVPVKWREAWNWARMRSHLDAIEARQELMALARRRRVAEQGLARFYREVIANAAWLKTKENATPNILQALAGYATALTRIGQGTGPNATRYRRDARECMFTAAGAVPCWIMNHNRVSESMPADVGVFDLVIVDEASQSDLWSLPAVLRGKKILVVGDDKQVSPDGGFIASSGIENLLHRFLEGQFYKAEMTPEKSLYDLAGRVFAADKVMLREHFRCVSPIITYSNQTFYEGQIAPLRIAKASERIDPPLVDLFVEGGRRDHRDRNDCEASAIADEIEAILADPNFANRTIGVVTLLGTEQAKLIDELVNERCDALELQRHRFLCGDARTFQGSERDIIFLSLVVDPTNCKAIAGKTFEQRFNVAASRARDRMYLVRSVTASELSPADLRTTLLSYFDKPFVISRSNGAELLSLCESGFEKQVYSALTERGYRVLPQVKAGAYRIDMVVEGAGDLRLAIECDGDEFHGPDRWQHDVARQRVLERAGWTFWRCFASTWTLNRDAVFQELLETLYSMGIEPIGAIEKSPLYAEKRTWARKLDKQQDSNDHQLSFSSKALPIM